MAVAAAVVVAGIAVLVRGGDDGDAPEPPVREELLDDLVADPACPDAAESPEPDDGEVRITVVRVVDGCLAYEGKSSRRPTSTTGWRG